MFKKLAITGVLFTAILVPVYSADAALFNWLYSATGNSFIVGSDSSIGRALDKVSDKNMGIKEEDASETQSYDFEGWLVNENIPAPPFNKYSSAPAKEIFTVMATAYSSTPDQTDDTPFVTARNTRVRDGLAAANFLPFGTEFRIPDLYGNKVFVVEDRMHKRYWRRVDIWFPERQMAKEFGVKQIRIEIVS
ncbi:MAG: 3D domain-containing protein [Candidatus Yanofskybacteria bacterium]|nr:3D domain-containing protein [Candidatus Yanofskybacteria bacterium]